VTIHIGDAETDAQIAATFAVMRQLRPHLVEDEYVPLVRGLMASDGLRLTVVLEDGTVRAVAGWRIMTMLYCGRLLYVDDLIADQASRSRGHGARLVSHLKQQARALGCTEVQLISHTRREQAHRFYFREGFGIECFHFRAKLD
jgi:GNAT superfamily N-acetyltransferase